MRLSDDAKYYIFMHETNKKLPLMVERINSLEEQIGILQKSLEGMVKILNDTLNKSIKKLSQIREKHNA